MTFFSSSVFFQSKAAVMSVSGRRRAGSRTQCILPSAFLCFTIDHDVDANRKCIHNEWFHLFPSRGRQDEGEKHLYMKVPHFVCTFSQILLPVAKQEGSREANADERKIGLGRNRWGQKTFTAKMEQQEKRRRHPGHYPSPRQRLSIAQHRN